MAAIHGHHRLDEEIYTEDSYNENADDYIEDVDAMNNTHVEKKKMARKSIEEYLENKRFRKQYKDLFDEEIDDGLI